MVLVHDRFREEMPGPRGSAGEGALHPDSDLGWARRACDEWERADEGVRSALADGLSEFERRTQDRVLGAFREGTLMINRCRRCRRVIRTPLARECLWCGHDWHG